MLYSLRRDPMRLSPSVFLWVKGRDRCVDLTASFAASASVAAFPAHRGQASPVVLRERCVRKSTVVACVKALARLSQSQGALDCGQIADPFERCRRQLANK
eukprot:1829331-Prymnesium_polylepis.2